MTIGYDSTNKLIQHRRKFQGNKTEAETALSLFVAEYTKGDYCKPQKLTVEGYLKNWLTDYAQPNVEATTFARYQQLVSNNINPHIGSLLLQEIKAPHFQMFYNQLRGENGRKNKKGGLSPTTVLQIHRVLSCAFKDALAGELIAKNPMVSVKPPKKESTEPQALTEEQVTYMLQKAFEEESFQFYVELAIGFIAGLRRGELLGLRWQDVDFENNNITVRQSLYYIKNRGQDFKKPKTKKSNDTIPMPEDMMDLLKQHKARQNEQRLKLGTKWHDNDLVFANWQGEPQSLDNLTHKFIDFMTRIGLPGFHLHNLRHSLASELANKGEQAKDVSERLRHSNISTTMNIYTKLFDQAKRKTADKLSGRLPSPHSKAGAV